MKSKSILQVNKYFFSYTKLKLIIFLLKDPDGNHITTKIISNHDGSYRVDFNPTEIGEYYIDVFYANQLVNGSPFKCNVYDPARIKIVPCLFGVVDQIAKFEG